MTNGGRRRRKPPIINTTILPVIGSGVLRAVSGGIESEGGMVLRSATFQDLDSVRVQMGNEQLTVCHAVRECFGSAAKKVGNCCVWVYPFCARKPTHHAVPVQDSSMSTRTCQTLNDPEAQKVVVKKKGWSRTYCPLIGTAVLTFGAIGFIIFYTMPKTASSVQTPDTLEGILLEAGESLKNAFSQLDNFTNPTITNVQAFTEGFVKFLVKFFPKSIIKVDLHCYEETLDVLGNVADRAHVFRRDKIDKFGDWNIDKARQFAARCPQKDEGFYVDVKVDGESMMFFENHDDPFTEYLHHKMVDLVSELRHGISPLPKVAKMLDELHSLMFPT